MERHEKQKREVLLLGSALNNTFELRKSRKSGEMKVQMIGTKRETCLDTQNGR